MKIIARIRVIAFVLVVSVVGTSISMGSPVPWNKRCQEFFYYDHGTDHCEHCSDICDAANLKGTMDQCWKQCQSYALNLWPPKQKNPILKVKPSEEKHLTPSPIKLDDESDQSSDNFPLEAKVIIPLLLVLAAAVLVPTLVFIKRRRNGMNNQGPPVNNRSSPHHQTTDQTATMEQTAAFLPDPVGENGSALDSSSRATRGTETSLSTMGIQEEGVAGSEERSQTRDETGERGPTVAQATSSRQEYLPTRLTQPVTVSPEGNEASFAMALLHSPKRLHLPAASQRSVSLTELDLDSTELKTLLPSMSEDSLTGLGED